MAIETSLHTAETSLAKQLGVDADYVEKLCFDIYDAIVIEERKNASALT
jgi:hypothetical protein